MPGLFERELQIELGSMTGKTDRTNNPDFHN
jgi:hypothetical protein